MNTRLPLFLFCCKTIPSGPFSSRWLSRYPVNEVVFTSVETFRGLTEFTPARSTHTHAQLPIIPGLSAHEQ